MKGVSAAQVFDRAPAGRGQGPGQGTADYLMTDNGRDTDINLMDQYQEVGTGRFARQGLATDAKGLQKQRTVRDAVQPVAFASELMNDNLRYPGKAGAEGKPAMLSIDPALLPQPASDT